MRGIYGLLRGLKEAINRLTRPIVQASKAVAQKIAQASRAFYLGMKHTFRLLFIHGWMPLWRLFKFVTRFLWHACLKYIYYFFKHVTVYALLLFRRSVAYLNTFVQVVIRGALKQLRRLASLIAHGVNKLYEVMFQPIFSLIFRVLRQIFKWLLDGITFLYKSIKPLFVFFFRGVRFVLNHLKKAIVCILKHTYLRIKRLVLGVYKLIKRVLMFMLNIPYHLPAFLYALIVHVMIYMYLIVHGVYVIVCHYMLYKWPKWLVIKLFHCIKWSILWALMVGIHGMGVISPALVKLNRALNRLRIGINDLIYDFPNYALTLLFAPLILPLFIALFVLSVLYLFAVSFFLALKALLALPPKGALIHPLYLPSIAVYKHASALYRDIVIDYTSATSIKSMWLMVHFVSWPIFLLCITFQSLVLLPLTLIAFVLHGVNYPLKKVDFDAFVKSRVINLERTNGFIHVESVKLYGKRIEFHTQNLVYADALKTYLALPEANEIVIHVMLNKTSIMRLGIPHIKTVEAELAYALLGITNQLRQEEVSEFRLPKHLSFEVTYEAVHRKDDIIGDYVYQRDYGLYSTLRLRVTDTSTETFMEGEITKPFINSAVINQLNHQTHALTLDSGFHFAHALDPRYTYTGATKRMHSTQETSEVTFQIKGMQAVFTQTFRLVHPLYIQCKLKQRIKAPTYDYETKTFSHAIQSVCFNGYERFVSWQFEMPDGVHNNEGVVAAFASFVFNHNTIIKQFNYAALAKESAWEREFKDIITPYHYISSTDKPYGKDLGKIAFYRFPRLGKNSLKVLYWKSLSPHLISSSGKVNKASVEVVFRVTVWENLLKYKHVLVRVKS